MYFFSKKGHDGIHLMLIPGQIPEGSESLAKCWFLEATIHLLTIPFPNRILLSVIDMDMWKDP